MYNNTKKDFIKFANELGTLIPDVVTIIKLKELIEQSDNFVEDPDFVKDLIISVSEDRKSQEAIESKRSENENKERIEKVKFEQQKLIEHDKLEFKKVKQLIEHDKLEFEKVKLKQLRNRKGKYSKYYNRTKFKY